MPSQTAGAIRQRRHRDRRARGYHIMGIEIGDADVAGLIDRGLLDRLQRRDPEAIQAALHRFLDQTLAGQ